MQILKTPHSWDATWSLLIAINYSICLPFYNRKNLEQNLSDTLLPIENLLGCYRVSLVRSKIPASLTGLACLLNSHFTLKAIFTHSTISVQSYSFE